MSNLCYQKDIERRKEIKGPKTQEANSGQTQVSFERRDRRE
jgi:hypothetical protein